MLAILRLLLMALLGFGALGGGSAAAVDLHAYWDGRCGGCHGHSADFARRFLAAENGKLLGRHHRDDLGRFLGNHFLAAELVEPMMGMLLAQVTTPPRFRAECSACHDTAAALARERLTFRDGVLYGSASGRKVDGFLPGHAGIQGESVGFYLALLRRVTAEVGR